MENNGIQNKEMGLSIALFSIFLCTVFGSNTVALKICLSGFGPLTTAGIRFGTAMILISLWALITGKTILLKKSQLKQVMIISLVFTVQFSLFHTGIHFSNASRASLITNVQPFFLLFLAHFFIPGDRITLKKIAGIALGFSGVAVLFLGGESLTSDLHKGDFFVLIGAFLWACNMTYTKRIIHDYQPFQMALYSMMFSAPAFIALGFFMDKQMFYKMNSEIASAFLYSTVIVASFGFVSWNTLLQKYGAVNLHTYVFIMPLAGVFFGWFILDEPVSANIIISLILILSGIITVHLNTKNIALLLSRRPGL